MNIRNSFILLCLTAFVLFSAEALSARSATPPTAKTGAPGEGLCTDCHTGNSVNVSGGIFSISGIPANYELDTEYPISVTLSKSDAKRWGFELAAMKDSDGEQAGTLLITDNTNTQIQTAGSIMYMSHTGAGTMAGQDGPTTWSFTWQSPSEDVGAVSFYASGNAANNGGTTSDDFIYTTSQQTQAPEAASGPFDFTLSLSSMDPHAGQTAWLRIVDQADASELVRSKKDSVEAAFDWVFTGILEAGHSYNVDLWVDFNGNGVYDVPSTDHAWRISVADVSDNVTESFVHNVTFTDIEWIYAVTMSFTEMSPHLDQLLSIRLVDSTSGTEVVRDTMTVSSAAFSVTLAGIDSGTVYNVDFYSDHNGNGSYDAPPADHAWRVSFTPGTGDTTLSFVHNTDFTDIEWDVVSAISAADATGIVTDYRLAQNFPNPFNPVTTIEYTLPGNADVQIIVYNILGQKVKTLVNRVVPAGTYRVLWDGTNDAGMQVAGGLYIYRLYTEKTTITRKMVFMK